MRRAPTDDGLWEKHLLELLHGGSTISVDEVLDAADAFIEQEPYTGEEFKPHTATRIEV